MTTMPSRSRLKVADTGQTSTHGGFSQWKHGFVMKIGLSSKRLATASSTTTV